MIDVPKVAELGGILFGTLPAAKMLHEII